MQHNTPKEIIFMLIFGINKKKCVPCSIYIMSKYDTVEQKFFYPVKIHKISENNSIKNQKTVCIFLEKSD